MKCTCYDFGRRDLDTDKTKVMELLNPIVNNEKRSRFETEINGEFAFVEYRFHEGRIVLMHTFVPESARGAGVASALAKFALEYIKAKNLKAIVYCPSVAAYLKRHPEYHPWIHKQ